MTQLTEIFERHFPAVAADGFFEFAYVSAEIRGDQIVATLRTIVFDMHGGQKSIRDVKEQHVDMGHEMNLTVPDRYEAFIEATTEIVARCDFEFLEHALPADLVDASVTDLTSVNDKIGFIKALSAKSRLGGHLA